PKRSAKIQQVKTETEKQEVIALLKEQYRRHALVQFDYLFIHDNYYVIKENNEIVAGCQFHKAHWVINKMPGLMGKIILKVVPRVPLLNKLFNPKKFEFLAFEGIYFKPGKEKLLYKLFEGLLAKEKLKSSLFWMGEKCPWYKALIKYGHLGLINNFVKDSDVYILASYKNMTPEEIHATENSPLFASGFDYI
ncbi:MAG TPA: hypothetical protein VN451_10800, partial [Chitinophagaceae bacterium]|nr:hypothetical protein [Chitinophagaceae bacterium]